MQTSRDDAELAGAGLDDWARALEDEDRRAGTAIISASDAGPPTDSVALAFQMRAIPRSALDSRIRTLSEDELAELELATDEALGRVDPER